jgi:hypothetical protein
VCVGERQVAEVRTTRFRHAQGVECEKAGQGVVVAAGQAGLNEERAELGSVESEPVDPWEIFGRRTWTAGECSRSCSSTQ